jgi:hypothetical protein
MKRISRNPARFEVMELFGALAREVGYRLDDQDAMPRFLARVQEGLAAGRDNPNFTHGRRIEGMFEHVVAGLGIATAIKWEDAGETCFSGPDIRSPDFRLILPDTEILVEVKNCHFEDPDHRYRLRQLYGDALQRYAQLFRRDLYFAIYWSRWGMWSLHTIGDFTHDRGWSISFPEAMMRNRMALLGDVHVGTTPPLTLRFVTDPNRPRTINGQGQCIFTIGRVDLLCAGQLIESQAEKNLAFSFMLSSNWPAAEAVPIVDNDVLEYIEFVAAPREPIEGQEFVILGSLSSMISRRYNDETAVGGVIHAFAPAGAPGDLAEVIPEDYRSEQLPLWRFRMAMPD